MKDLWRQYDQEPARYFVFRSRMHTSKAGARYFVPLHLATVPMTAATDASLTFRLQPWKLPVCP